MEFLVLIALFWLPPVVIFFRNIIWNLHLWEQKQYRLDRFISFIKWDYQPRNRNIKIYNIKFLVFSLTTTLVVSIYSSSIGVLLAYAIWVLEIFTILSKVFSGESEKITLNIRNFLSLLIFGALTSILIVTISLPFAQLQRESGFPIGEIATSYNGRSIQDVYIYLAISTIIALFIDILSPIIVGIIVLITSPIGWLRNKISIHNLNHKISEYRNNLIVILITGSIGKTVTKEILYSLIKNEFSIVKTSNVYTTIQELSHDISSQINASTQVLLVEAEPFKPGELRDICNVLNPDISIITDIDAHHYSSFKTKEEYIKSRLEVLEGTNHNGTIITPIDNKHILRYLHLFPGHKEGITYLGKTSKKLSQVNSIEMYKKSVNGYKFMIKTQDDIFEYSTPLHRSSIIKQLIPAILAAHKLGLDHKTLRDRVNKLQDKFTSIYTLEGDENTLLVSSGNPDSNLRGVIATIDYSNNIKNKFKNHRIVLVTDGISELGRIKRKSYAKLIEKLKNKVSIVVTSDPLLYDLLSHCKLDLLTFRSNKTQDTIFTLRTLIKTGDIVIVEGKDTEEILSSLRSQE